jgi:uncharacterized membrane protein YjjP (DUF1212 family)
MKKLTTFILSTFFAIIAFAGNVTITINGNQNMHVLIDGKTYTLANFKKNGANSKSMLITNLANGQHTIKVFRATTANRRSTEVYSSTFTLRSEYDMKITVNGNNGRVKMAEVLINGQTTTQGNSSQKEMSASTFNELYQTISRKWSEDTKYAEANTTFTSTTNKFSTDQIGQIIALVATENNRLLLAKNAYNNVVDPANYTQLNDLFNTQSYRDDLAAFIRSNGTSGNTSTSRVVMPDATFNQIYRSVNDQWSSSSKYTAANNAFSAASNYFSIDQVGRIISLITSETSRLQLIKNALDNIVAPANYADLYDLLSTQASKTDLDNYLRSNGYPTTGTDPYSSSNNGARVVMSDANFNTIYRSVNDQWSASAKYSTANSAFSTATNFFNINQVKQIVSLITSEASRMDLVKNALDNIITPANYVELYDLFNSQSSRVELDTYLRNNGYSTGTDPYSNSNNNGARVVMSDANFNTIYRSVNDQWSPNAKYSTANSAFGTATNYFNINQVKQIISLITSEASRLDLVKNALDNIITPANYVELYDLFNSQSSRTELDTYLRNNGYTNTSTDTYNNNNNNPSTTRTAMSEASFNNIYQTIRSQWLPLGKYSAATDAFSNPSYYYTTYQAKQIIGLLSSEDNRLQLAKNAYDNIVDPSNIAQLYDLFTLQANKDALEAYIRNYRN